MLKIHQKMTNNASETLTTRGRQPVTPFYYTVIAGAPPGDITSLFVSRPDIQDLLNVKPYLLSYFVPYVRIYKVFGSARGPVESECPPGPEDTAGMATEAAVAESTRTSRHPISDGTEVEFVFDDHIKKQQIENILASHKGRAGAVGLKSVNWNFLGVQPAEVENNIKLNLTLYFNDFTEFEKEREDPSNSSLKYRFSDLILHSPMYNINADSPGFSELQRAFNPNFFRIKIVAGWTFLPSIPGNEGIIDEISSDDIVDIEKISDLVVRSRKVMYMNLMRHNLEFNQDGSMELTAEYQALIEGVFASRESDILNVQSGFGTCSEQRRLRETRAGLRRTQNMTSAGEQLPGHWRSLLGDEAAPSLNDVQDHLRQRAQVIQTLLEASTERDKALAYQSIMRNLMLSGKIYTCNVRNESLGFSANFDPLTAVRDEEGNPIPFTTEDISDAAATSASEADEAGEHPIGEEAIEGATRTATREGTLQQAGQLPAELRAVEAGTLRRMVAIARFYNNTDFDIASDFTAEITDNAETALGQNSFSQFGGGVLGPSLALMLAADEGTTEAMYEVAANTAETFVSIGGTAGVIPIEFMFFGDILDTVMGPLLGWLREDNVEVMLGTFLYSDPTNQSAEPVPVPLAHIPISTELFSMWFLQEIVEKKKTSMTLRSFFRSVFDKLIINAFGSDCVYDTRGQFTLIQEGLTVIPEYYTILKRRLSQAGILRTNSNLGDVSRNTVSHGDIRARVSRVGLLDNLSDTSFDRYASVVLYQHQTQEHTRGQIFDTDMSSGYLRTAERDARIGIYHLNLGSDRGLVKRIEFQRMDQDHAPEARMAAAGALNQFDQLRERYNATVTMYGNTFFYPGQHIYINPSMVGANTVADAAALTTKLGIGGYFVIIKVENIIESGLFETILDCRWVTSGFISSQSANRPTAGDPEAEVDEFLATQSEEVYQQNVVNNSRERIQAAMQDPLYSPEQIGLPRGRQPLPTSGPERQRELVRRGGGPGAGTYVPPSER